MYTLGRLHVELEFLLNNLHRVPRSCNPHLVLRLKCEMKCLAQFMEAPRSQMTIREQLSLNLSSVFEEFKAFSQGGPKFKDW